MHPTILTAFQHGCTAERRLAYNHQHGAWLDRYIWLDAGLNGYPPMPADWLTVAELLGKYDHKGRFIWRIFWATPPCVLERELE